MKKIIISIVLVSLCRSQSPEVRKYKQDIKTSFGKEKVEPIGIDLSEDVCIALENNPSSSIRVSDES